MANSRQPGILGLVRYALHPDLTLARGLASAWRGWPSPTPTRHGSPGRLLGDPMPIVLAFNGLRSVLIHGFLYYDRRSPLLHLLFAAALGSAAAAATWPGRPGSRPSEAARAGGLAALVNLLPPAPQEVDTLMVGVFYLAAAYVSLWVARRVAVAWPRRI